jgi:hypothetical protein
MPSSAVVSVGPQRRAGRRIHQVRADAHVPSLAPYRTVEHVAAVQSLRSLGFAFAAELKARGPADHSQTGAASQTLNDVLADAVGEELHLDVVREIVEGEHGDHRTFDRHRQRRRLHHVSVRDGLVR